MVGTLFPNRNVFKKLSLRALDELLESKYPEGDPALLQDMMFNTILGAVESLAEQNGAPNLEYTEEQKLRLGHLMGEDSVSTLLRDIRGDSGEVIEALEEISMSDVDTSQLTSIIDKHLQGYNPFAENPFFSNFDYLNYDEMMEEIRSAYDLQGLD